MKKKVYVLILAIVSIGLFFILSDNRPIDIDQKDKEVLSTESEYDREVNHVGTDEKGDIFSLPTEPDAKDEDKGDDVDKFIANSTVKDLLGLNTGDSHTVLSKDLEIPSEIGEKLVYWTNSDGYINKVATFKKYDKDTFELATVRDTSSKKWKTYPPKSLEDAEYEISNNGLLDYYSDSSELMYSKQYNTSGYLFKSSNNLNDLLFDVESGEFFTLYDPSDSPKEFDPNDIYYLGGDGFLYIKTENLDKFPDITFEELDEYITSVNQDISDRKIAFDDQLNVKWQID